jgi:hypothetical protein
MPVVINEIELVDQPVPQPAQGTPATPRRTEPIHEQLRLLQRDLEARQRRLIAD